MYCNDCKKALKSGEKVYRVTGGHVITLNPYVHGGEGESFFDTKEPNDYYHERCLRVVVSYPEIHDR